MTTPTTSITMTAIRNELGDGRYMSMNVAGVYYEGVDSETGYSIYVVIFSRTFSSFTWPDGLINNIGDRNGYDYLYFGSFYSSPKYFPIISASLAFGYVYVRVRNDPNVDLSTYTLLDVITNGADKFDRFYAGWRFPYGLKNSSGTYIPTSGNLKYSHFRGVNRYTRTDYTLPRIYYPSLTSLSSIVFGSTLAEDTWTTLISTTAWRRSFSTGPVASGYYLYTPEITALCGVKNARPWYGPNYSNRMQNFGIVLLNSVGAVLAYWNGGGRVEFTGGVIVSNGGPYSYSLSPNTTYQIAYICALRQEDPFYGSQFGDSFSMATNPYSYTDYTFYIENY